MNLKKCKSCGKYTLKESCQQCKNKTTDTHYKFIPPRTMQARAQK